MTMTYEQKRNYEKTLTTACVQGFNLDRLKTMLESFYERFEIEKQRVVDGENFDDLEAGEWLKAKEDLENTMNSIKTFSEAILFRDEFNSKFRYTKGDDEFYPENLMGLVHCGLVLEDLIKQMEK